MTDSPGRMPPEQSAEPTTRAERMPGQPTESTNRADASPCSRPTQSATRARNSQPPQDENPWATAGLVMGLGVELAACVGLGWWLGTVYDERNGTESGYLVGVIVGLVAGIGSAIALVRKYTEKRRT